jgi:predicted PurR-regulated permease PerM
VIIIASLVGVLVLACLVTSLVFLLNPNLTRAEDVSRIRDVFIIIMALESLLIGAVLVVLIVQIARLTNLLQNEIKPILDSTNETVSTLRGTTEFLSDNLVQPVIKLNEYIAAIQKLLELLGVGRRKI